MELDYLSFVNELYFDESELIAEKAMQLSPKAFMGWVKYYFGNKSLSYDNTLLADVIIDLYKSYLTNAPRLLELFVIEGATDEYEDKHTWQSTYDGETIIAFNTEYSAKTYLDKLNSVINRFAEHIDYSNWQDCDMLKDALKSLDDSVEVSYAGVKYQIKQIKLAFATK